jgi:hypothetical protein
MPIFRILINRLEYLIRSFPHHILFGFTQQETGLTKLFLPKLSLWYCNDFGKDMKGRIAKLHLISKKGGKSEAVLFEFLQKYESAGKRF